MKRDHDQLLSVDTRENKEQECGDSPRAAISESADTEESARVISYSTADPKRSQATDLHGKESSGSSNEFGRATEFESISGAAAYSLAPSAKTPALVFTPSRPKFVIEEFSGRLNIISGIKRAIESKKSHLVIFGSRGVGKTSVTNIMAESLKKAGYQVVRNSCSSDITFSELMQSLLSQLTKVYETAGQNRRSLSELLPPGAFGISDLINVLDLPKNQHVVLIIDEFDRAKNVHLKNQMAELIKALSDSSRNVTFVIVGVAKTLQELIGEHCSIQRQLSGIHLPNLSLSETESMIVMGEHELGLNFASATRELIVALSRGRPHSAQLLCLYATESALARKSGIVEMLDCSCAIDWILRDDDQIMNLVYKMVKHDDAESAAMKLIISAAFSKWDPYGRFTVFDIIDSYRALFGYEISDVEVHRGLTSLNTASSQIIQGAATVAGGGMYSFVDPNVPFYITLREVQRGGILSLTWPEDSPTLNLRRRLVELETKKK